MNAPDATPPLRWDPKTGQLAQFVPTRVSWNSDGAPLPGSERWIVTWCQPGSGISMRWLTDEEALTWVSVIVLPVPDNADPKLAVLRSVGLFGMAITYDGHLLDPTKVMLSTVSDGTDLVSLQSENARLRSLVDELRTAQPDAATLARRFHEAYEALAPAFGYRTREASAKPWGDVPIQNKKLMIATAQAVLESWPLTEAADVPTACVCLNWAGDMRVPRPNGHHPLCDGTGQHRVEIEHPGNCPLATEEAQRAFYGGDTRAMMIDCGDPDVPDLKRCICAPDTECANPRHAHTLNEVLSAADPDGIEDPLTYQHCADCHGDEHDHLAARGENTVGSGPHCGHTAGCPNC